LSKPEQLTELPQLKSS